MDVERVVSMPVINPETGRASRSFVFMGVVDLVEDDKIIDYKGTSRVDRFISQLTIGFQAELYALAVQSDGRKILEIEYRVIARPGKRYSRPTFRYAVVKPSRKTAIRVFDNEEEAKKLAVMQGADVEVRVGGDADRNAYETRCLDWLLEDPARLLTHPYFVTPAKLKRAQEYLWDCSKRILDSRANDRWIPNCKACFAYDRPCEYLPLCEAVVNGGFVNCLTDGYRQIKTSHPELQGNDAEGIGILTYSSLSDLTLCEQLFRWRHEIRIQKRVAEDPEPLWTGSAMHRGVAAYATDGKDVALKAVDAWADENPILGEDAAWRQDEQVARARAMVRAAALKWPVTESSGS